MQRDFAPESISVTNRTPQGVNPAARMPDSGGRKLEREVEDAPGGGSQLRPYLAATLLLAASAASAPLLTEKTRHEIYGILPSSECSLVAQDFDRGLPDPENPTRSYGCNLAQETFDSRRGPSDALVLIIDPQPGMQRYSSAELIRMPPAGIINNAIREADVRAYGGTTTPPPSRATRSSKEKGVIASR